MDTGLYSRTHYYHCPLMRYFRDQVVYSRGPGIAIPVAVDAIQLIPHRIALALPTVQTSYSNVVYTSMYQVCIYVIIILSTQTY
jgi:hypothetical protein